MRVKISMLNVALAAAELAVVMPVMVSAVAALKLKKMPAPEAVSPLLVLPLGLACRVV
jgi:hypothetical protein